MNYQNFTVLLKDLRLEAPKDIKGLDNIEKKLSHKGKTLLLHIEEIINFGDSVLEYYGFKKEHREILKFLAVVHDLGKLNLDWNVEKEIKPRHSLLSVEMYRINKEKFLRLKIFDNTLINDEKLEKLLLYLIEHHHSILRRKWEIIKLVKEFSGDEEIYKVIDIVDIYGIFKIADIVSGGDMLYLSNNFKSTLMLTEDSIKEKITNCDQNKWQKQLQIKNIKDNCILVAPTGWGKTYASLLFASNKKFKKIFYILPTITAIKVFTEKLEAIFGKEKVDAYFYFYDVWRAQKEDLNVVDIFLAENFFKPIIVTTIDQFLITFLQIGKYFLKRFSFRDSLIIVDEFHLLNPVMIKLFIGILKQFQEIYNIKFLLMSATLSRGIIEFLSEELGIEEKNILNFKNEYKNLKRHKIAYFNCDITDKEAIDIIIKKIKENKKILILLNTVNKSILLKQKLDELLGDKHKIVLLHSRFMTKDRFKKEEEIFDLLNQNAPHIFIATQVAEVSLDISYDYLFTELSSFSSFIQRCGRVNRFNNFVKYENVFVFYPSEINKLSERNKNKYPYSNDEIKELEQILLEIKNKDYNEFDLINLFDEINSKDNFIKKYQKESNKVVNYSYIFTNVLNEIFSLDCNEETVRNTLNYREEFNVLSIPQVYNIEDENIKTELEKTLRLEFKYRDFEENMKKFRKIKEFLIPVPIWFSVSDFEESYFPIIKKDYFYNKELGLYKKEFKDEDLIL